MLFPTATFASFFVAVYGLHVAFRARRTPWMLAMLAASLLFYGWTDPRLLVLLAGVTIVTHQSVGALASRSRTATGRLIVVADVVLVCSLLAVFKYLGFITEATSELVRLLGGHFAPSPPPLVLPLGISFMTFQALGYCIDAYRGTVEGRPDPLDTALFIAFFPHVASGPILRAKPFLAQMRAWPRETGSLGAAAVLIVMGLAKKVVVADALFEVTRAVNADPDACSALDIAFNFGGGLVAVYCDLSSYTDIALGVALLLGVRLPQNFNRPFAATSLSEYWRRWHISMSSWFRDYVFTPLKGTSLRGRRLAAAALATMVLSGLWHGAGWGYLLWGALQGVGLVVETTWRTRRLVRRRRAVRDPASVRPSRAPILPAPVRTALCGAAAFSFFAVTGGLFTGDSVRQLLHELSLLGGSWTTSTLITPIALVGAVAVVAAQLWGGGRSERVAAYLDRCHPAAVGASFATATTVVFALAVPGIAPFLYFGV